MTLCSAAVSGAVSPIHRGHAGRPRVLQPGARAGAGARGASRHQPRPLLLLLRPPPEGVRAVESVDTLGPGLGGEVEDDCVPLPDVLRPPEHEAVLPGQLQQQREVALPVHQRHAPHVAQAHLEGRG